MQTGEESQPTSVEQQVAERTRELAVLNSIAAVVSQSLDAQQLLAAALDEVLGLLNLSCGLIYTLQAQEQLQLIVQRGLSAEQLAVQPTELLEQSLAGLAVRSGRAVAYTAPEQAIRALPVDLPPNTRTALGVPLRSLRRVIGVLVLLSSERLDPDSRELRLLEAIGDHIGVALANAYHFEAEQRRRRQAETLQEVANIVGSSLTLQEVLQRILEQLNRVVPYDSASVQLLRDDTLEVIAAHGFKQSQKVIGLQFALDDDHPNTPVIRQGRPLILNDAAARYHSFSQDPHRQVRSWLGVPLSGKGRPIGMLTLDRLVAAGFQGEEAALAASFASQAALAIERAQLLEAERQRREVAEVLREGLMALTSTLDLTTVLDAIVNQACRLMSTEHCAIYELGDDGFLRPRAACGLPDDYLRSVQLPLGQPAVGLAVQERRIVALPDAQAIAERLEERHYDPATLQQIRQISTWLHSLMAAPIIAGDELFGGIVVYYEDAGEFSAAEEATLTIFASQAALAIKNARLLERERRQRAELQQLNDRIAALNAIGRAAASSLEPAQTLPALSAAVQRLLAHDRLLLALLDERQQQLSLLAYPAGSSDGQPGPYAGQRLLALLPPASPLLQALTEGRPIVVDCLSQHSGADDPLLAGLRALLAVPLVLHGRMVGALCLGRAGAETDFNAEQMDLASQIAEEIAAAIVNAQLYHRSRELVLAEERNRLARELHDSVTQSLFSISLSAQTARMRLDLRPEQTDRLVGLLETIQQLAQSSLGEMRALISELRPAELGEEGLQRALERHVAAFRTRAGLEVTLQVDEALGSYRLPAPLEQAAYRIVQEALHNVYKHAAAQQVRISMGRHADWLMLSIADDGRGFDPAAPQEGQHLGRSSMRERAEALGGRLTISSAPGCGTLVRAELPLGSSSSPEAPAAS